MELGVSDSERPGHGVLTVTTGTGARGLLISLKSARIKPGEYLGPGGNWAKTPHFFEAPRIPSEGPARFRIGPEIVNHVLAFDRIEIAADGVGLLGEIDWPELTPGPVVSSTGHSIYRDVPRAAQPTAAVKRQPVKPVQVEPVPEAIQPSPAAQVRRPEPTKPQPVPPPAPGPTPSSVRSGRRVIVGVLAVVLILACGIGVYAARCTLFGLSCETTGEFDDAMACAERKRVSSPCSAKSCFEGTLDLSRLQQAQQAAIARVKLTLEDLCLTADGEAAASARECIATQRRTPPECPAAQNCISPYAAQFPAGIHRGELEALARQTASACAAGAAQDNRDYINAANCASRSKACYNGIGMCYEVYLSAHPGGLHEAAAREAIARVRRLPCQDTQEAPSMPDGVYNGVAEANRCGVRPSVRISAQNGSISWEHDANGVSNKWVGRVAQRGEITAQVTARADTRATGRYSGSDHFIVMTYPECGTVKVNIYGAR